MLGIALCGSVMFAGEPLTEGRMVLVHKKDIVPVSTHLRYTTLIELPFGEEVSQEYCGDRDFWAINDQRNAVFVKPLGEKAGRKSNLFVLTNSGNLYSFSLSEVSNEAERADMKLTIQQGDEDGRIAIKDTTATSNDVAAELKRVEYYLASAKATPSPHAAALAEEKVHDYSWPKNKVAERFGLRDIYHDSRFTYIQADTQDAPSLYEIKDGKDAIVQYKLENGEYKVPKVLDAGYLRIGRAKLEFKRGS